MTAASIAEMPDADAAARDLAAARRVLRLEADALGAIAAGLDGRFSLAVETLAAVRGRVIVTGMGKSGHVARKIAATMASTGNPAQYIHPGEASHGDLGMIAPRDDAVLALSNSGETAELGDVLDYCSRFDVPLVAITSRAGSTLGQVARVTLTLPATSEACPLGLAPTTSTTAMLALGDALAIALLERRGFTAEHFQVLHPGGRLGRRLLRVGDLMHGGAELPLAGPETPMADAILVMTTRRFGCVGIVDGDGCLAGIVTDGDLRRHMAPDLLRQTAGAVMTARPQTIRATALASEALGLMNARQITSLFVVRDGTTEPVGIVHIHDLLRAGVA
ncbi:MAG: KpsF/GutQ family sugar-phosphate isomerase [Alphaproteobacteria bacterium]|nr:KpsF/GutQ family sugar-phosphate isomerase [Alphaproteobacteria bacterium]